MINRDGGLFVASVRRVILKRLPADISFARRNAYTRLGGERVSCGAFRCEARFTRSKDVVYRVGQKEEEIDWMQMHSTDQNDQL